MKQTKEKGKDSVHRCVRKRQQELDIYFIIKSEKRFIVINLLLTRTRNTPAIFIYILWSGSRRQQQQQTSPQQAAREVLTVVKRETANSNGNIEARACCTHRQQLRLKKLLCLDLRRCRNWVSARVKEGKGERRRVVEGAGQRGSVCVQNWSRDVACLSLG